jgi:hypothetical protein
MRIKIPPLYFTHERLFCWLRLLSYLCKGNQYPPAISLSFCIQCQPLLPARARGKITDSRATPVTKMACPENAVSHQVIMKPSLLRITRHVSISGKDHQLFLAMTAAVVSQNAFFKAYFLRRKSEGLIPQKALLATAIS